MTLPVHKADADVSINVPFVDDLGASLTPVSGTYRVMDESESDIVASAAISVAGSSVDITIPAVSNAVASGTTRGIRTVEVTLVMASSTHVIRESYIIQALSVLAVMTNSYQTIAQAELRALELPRLGAWHDKTENERINAMIDAFHHIGKMRFSVKSSVDSQSLLEPGNITNISKLNSYDLADFLLLDAAFLEALRRAQVVEADNILGGDIVGEQRRVGLMSQTIGESSHFFRPTKPVQLPVSVEALRYLQGYVDHNVRITRG